VNLTHIIQLTKEAITFDTGEEFYFPATQYNNLRTAWHKYSIGQKK